MHRQTYFMALVLCLVQTPKYCEDIMKDGQGLEGVGGHMNYGQNHVLQQKSLGKR